MNTRGYAVGPITHVCQGCGGDMTCISHGTSWLPHYVCQVCRRVWRYVSGGWQLVIETPAPRP